MPEGWKDPKDFHTLKTRVIVDAGHIDRNKEKIEKMQKKFDTFYDEEFQPLRRSHNRMKDIVYEWVDRNKRIKGWINWVLKLLLAPVIIAFVSWIWSLIHSLM